MNTTNKRVVHDSASRKIISLATAVALRKKAKKDGKTVGVSSGSFDVLTGRHFKSLLEWGSRVDVLIVLVNSDASIRAYKGKSRPIIEESERAYIVAQSSGVHAVVLFDQVTPNEVLIHIQPDIYFNGSEWGADCVERNVVVAGGGRVQASDTPIPNTWTTSTTALLSKISFASKDSSAKAVFFDRDGVINHNAEGYLHTFQDMRILPHVVTTMKQLMKAGYVLIVVTNQSGIGRGYYSAHDVMATHKKMRLYFKERGVHITDFYFCPHHPDVKCVCRKPEPGMLLKAAEEHNLNLSKSYIIGDSEGDIGAGHLANVQTIFFNRTKRNNRFTEFRPRHSITDIRDAAHIILDTKKSR
jgi:D-glycero-D-manno-heptose 1,7-bisphosphate phosphatase